MLLRETTKSGSHVLPTMGGRYNCKKTKGKKALCSTDGCVCVLNSFRDLENVESRDRNVNGTQGGVDHLVWVLSLAAARGTFPRFFAEVHVSCWSLKRLHENKGRKRLLLGSYPG